MRSPKQNFARLQSLRTELARRGFDLQRTASGILIVAISSERTLPAAGRQTNVARTRTNQQAAPAALDGLQSEMAPPKHMVARMTA